MHRALLLALALALPLLALGCGGGEEKTATPDTVEGTVGQETTTAQETATGQTPAQGDPQAGKQVFASAGCGGCHTLEAANASGTTGPNLDELKPSYDEAFEQVENGGGGMPAFKDQLDEKQIADVAAFVVQSTGG